ncbi:hypothetical protein DY023_02985 [Microbacterium bovistercoris]|uniref:Integral membrane protein n=1 Tax=Microbacterium bovistercoris TaxID=2293570 RepID=A0A371NX53_9MICO|nr:hypothetical protein [Microbacterium bovistercoris]REJ07619.1 hypothetical protein DY023_02985 [Microbacterium bovistercoris]
MYILLALIASCALGIGLHFLLPHRHLRGVAVAPAIATAASGVIYTAMQWAGVAESNGWLWLASIGGGLLIAALATYLLAVVRHASDEKTQQAIGV